MKKEFSLRLMMTIAAGAALLDALFGCFFVLAPETACSFMLRGANYYNDYSLGIALPFMMIKAFFPMLLVIIGVINACTTTNSRTKGLATVIAAVVSYIIDLAGGGYMNVFVFRLAAHRYGAEKVALLSAVSNVSAYFNWLSTAALVLIVSAAAVEMYAAKRSEYTYNEGNEQ